MKTIRNLSLALVVLCASAFGQASFTTTTLSKAVSADASISTVVLASATGVNAPALPFSQGGVGSPSAAALTLLMIDNEVFRVNGLSGTTVAVERGSYGTNAQAHAASAKVWVGPASYFTENEPSGVCVAAQQRVLPIIVLATPPPGGRRARAWDCNLVWGTYDGYSNTEGATIASATTIAPRNSIVPISGTTAVVTVTVPSACLVAATSSCQITLIPTGAFTTTTGGNLLHATTAVVGQALVLTYQPSAAKWALSY